MKVLTCGATGYGNRGDDAIRDCIASAIRQAVPDAWIVSTRPAPKRELVEWADKVVIGGGGILYDDCQANFNNYFGSYLRWANELSKPVCVCSIGVNHSLKPQNVAFLREHLRPVTFLSVRHQQNRKTLEGYGLHDNILVGDDIAHLTPAASTRYLPEGRFAAIVPHYKMPTWYDDASFGWFVDQLRTLGLRPVVATLSDEDNGYAKGIASGKRWEAFYHLPPNDLVSLFSGCEAVFSGRLHGLILATAAGSKAFSIGDGFNFAETRKLIDHVGEANTLVNIIRERNAEALAKALQTGGHPPTHGTAYVHSDMLQRFLGATQ